MDEQVEQSLDVPAAPTLGNFIAASLLTAYGIAMVFVIVLWCSLPHSDMASRESAGAVLGDPFVLGTAAIVATVSGLLFAKNFRRYLKCTDLRKSVLFVAGVAAAEVVIVTPFLGFAGWIGSYVAVAVALRFAARVRSFNRNATLPS